MSRKKFHKVQPPIQCSFLSFFFLGGVGGGGGATCALKGSQLVYNADVLAFICTQNRQVNFLHILTNALLPVPQ